MMALLRRIFTRHQTHPDPERDAIRESMRQKQRELAVLNDQLSILSGDFPPRWKHGEIETAGKDGKTDG